jgi:hypothetical protein
MLVQRTFCGKFATAIRRWMQTSVVSGFDVQFGGMLAAAEHTQTGFSDGLWVDVNK